LIGSKQIEFENNNEKFFKIIATSSYSKPSFNTTSKWFYRAKESCIRDCL